MKLFRVFLLVAACLLVPLFTSRGATNIVETDICIYGGTSGGVAAAVAAARLGKSVVLVSINNHVGGMSSGGLGVTDRGNTASIGGISREFYLRVGQQYGSGGPVYFFEPHVAENVFHQMLNEAGIPLYTNQRLASVTMSGLRITQMTMEDGTIFRAKMFVDTTYEGDLMAKAGVTFTVGRESTSTYGESLAGIRSLGGSYNYDPYVVPGNPASGLLPFVQTNTGGIVGQGDHRVQTYNFRLCLTQNATNKIAIAAPTNYAEATYELFARYIEARIAANGYVSLSNVIDIQTIIPNGKTDINARDELSTDFVGASYTWATNSYAGREVIRQQHEDYIRGLLYFYATSSRAPANLRAEVQSWGLAANEFTDSGGWPHQIYVREARRMVSDYVMIQQNATGQRAALDSIALASYSVDSHGVQRLALGNLSRWEGSIGGTVPFPYGVSYHSIVARTGECENVVCTFALSASHVGFSSCRMEPVLMMTSQSAATAAAFAIDDNVSAQQVNYPKLAAQLRADGQLLTWTSAAVSTNGIVLDQGGPGTTFSSGWANGANAGGWNGDYWHDGSTGKGSRWVKYTPTLPTNGTYEVYAWWVSDPNRATNTPIDVIHAAGTNRALVNQRNSSGGWFFLMATNFNAGTNGSVIIRNDNTLADTYCIADGIRFVGTGIAAVPPQPPTIEIVASDAVAGEFGTNLARFAVVRGGDTNPVVMVNYLISGSASNGVDYNVLPGNITLASGVSATNIFISPVADNLIESDESVTLTLGASTNYTFTSVSNATVVIHDRPIDEWRRANFTALELTNSLISSDLADPDNDSLANLMEYAFGLSPKIANPSPFTPRVENGHLVFTYTRLKAATDISLVMEKSDDLLTWQNNPAFFEQLDCVDEGAVQRITMRLASPVSAAINAYVRVKVTKL